MILTMVPALDRTLRLLQIVSHSPNGALTASELRAALGIPRASFFRLLSAMLRQELLFQDPKSGAYRLGARLMQLGFTARERYPLAELARPLLREISAASHQMSELIIGMGSWRLLTLEVWTAERTPLRFRARAGMFFPLHHLTAHGIVYLSCGSERRLAEYIQLARTDDGRRQLALPARLPADFEEQCQRWRELGYAWRRQSFPEGNARVSVPVYDPHNRAPALLATLGIACPSDELDSIRAARWAGILQQHARALEKSLS